MKIKDIKDKAIREKAEHYRSNENYSSEYLNDAFLWDYTDEGYDYWLGVNNGGIQETEKYKPTLKEEAKCSKLSLDDVNDEICRTMEIMKAEFCQKNNDYNNSLHRPNVFGQEPIEGLKARMSDKLNRILSKGLDDKTEDSMRDLFGYYVHYCIMKRSKLTEQEKENFKKVLKAQYKG